MDNFLMLIELGTQKQNVGYEVHAGLTSLYNDPGKGWVADDVHSGSASRTLGYFVGLVLPLPTTKYPMSVVDIDECCVQTCFSPSENQRMSSRS